MNWIKETVLPKFKAFVKIKETEEDAANAVLAWYNHHRTKKATENVIQATDDQPTVTPQTIQEMMLICSTRRNGHTQAIISNTCIS